MKIVNRESSIVNGSGGSICRQWSVVRGLPFVNGKWSMVNENCGISTSGLLSVIGFSWVVNGAYVLLLQKNAPDFFVVTTGSGTKIMVPLPVVTTFVSGRNNLETGNVNSPEEAFKQHTFSAGV